MSQSMLLRIRELDTQRMVPHFLPLIAQLENKHTEYMPVPARINTCLSYLTAIVISIGKSH